MKRLFSLLFLLVALEATAGDYSFRLKNELGFSRQGETVEVAVPEGLNLSNTTLSDEEGRTLPFELCGQHGIRFQAPSPTGRQWAMCSATVSAGSLRS